MKLVNRPSLARVIGLFLVGALVGALVALPIVLSVRRATEAGGAAGAGSAESRRGPDGYPFGVIKEGEPCLDPVEVPVEQLMADSTLDVERPEADAAGASLVGAEFCGGARSLPVLTYTLADIVAGSGPGQRQSMKKIDPATEIWVFTEGGYLENGRREWLQGLARDAGGKFQAVKGSPAYSEPASTDPAVRNQVIVGVPHTDRIVRIQSPWTVSPDQLWKVARALPIAE
jgi:hypothetical protein